MKKFHWILLSGLLVASTQIAHAQAPSASPGPGSSGSQEFNRGPGGFGAPGGGSAVGDAGAISNAPGASTTTTTTTTGIPADTGFVNPDDAAFGTPSSSNIPDTGGEPLIVVLAGLSIAGAAVAMRRKVTA